jgi:hypothetical protein
MTGRRSVLVAVALVLGTASAFAQTQVRFVEYSAKFLCGVSDGKEAGSAAVRPGTYETTINIHNPQLPTNPLPFVVFAKKAVLAPPEGEKPIPPSKFRVDRLQADFAEQVDCKIIRDMLGPAGVAPFIEGFLVLYVVGQPLSVAHELDVVGVYTVDTPAQSISLEMMPIAPRVLTLPGPAGRQLRERIMGPEK